MRKNLTKQFIMSANLQYLFIAAIVLVAIIMLPEKSYSQSVIGRAIQNKVEQKVIQKTEEAIDEAVDNEATEEDSTEQAPAEEQQSGENETPEETKPQSTAPVKQKLETKTQYDLYPVTKFYF